jgi:5-methylthioadenosine/S-adenosylhomocysteine deaminase
MAEKPIDSAAPLGEAGVRQPCDILIAGGIVLTMNAERQMISDGAVAVDGPLIAAVGKRTDLELRFAPRRTIDARNMVVMPGLINCHVHLQTTAKGTKREGVVTSVGLKEFAYPLFAAQTEESQYWDAMLVMAEMIKTGTTTCCEPNATHWGSAVQAALDSGMRAALGPWIWDQKGPDADKCPAYFRKQETEGCLIELEDGIRRHHGQGEGRIKATAAIEGVATCSDELILGAYALAEKYDTLTIQHKATSKEEVAVELAAYGHRPVEHMYRLGALGPRQLLAHMVCLDDDEVRMVAETDTKVSQNPSAALKLVKGTTVFGKFPEMVAAGVAVGLGTDAVNASNFMDLVRAMYLATVLPRDSRLDPAATKTETAVEMATVGGARALGWEREIGALQPGMRADVTLFDTRRPEWQPLFNPVNNLVYSADGHSAHTVIVDGKIVMEAQKIIAFDEYEVMDRQRAVGGEILQKLGFKLTTDWPLI